MGSFMADVTLPDLKKAPLKMSSIVLAAARQPSKRQDPLVRNGEEYVPNISHVFRQDQHMYLLYEVYDPAREKAAENEPKGTKPGHQSVEQPGTDSGLDKGVRDTAGAGRSRSTWKGATRWRLRWMCRWPD